MQVSSRKTSGGLWRREKILPKVLQDAPPWYSQRRRAYEKRNSASCLQAARVDFAVVGERLASAILRSMPANIHRWNG